MVSFLIDNLCAHNHDSDLSFICINLTCKKGYKFNDPGEITVVKT